MGRSVESPSPETRIVRASSIWVQRVLEPSRVRMAREGCSQMTPHSIDCISIFVIPFGANLSTDLTAGKTRRMDVGVGRI
jgi:hypothetical protein